MKSCRCPAYKFPHRPLSGECTGHALKQAIVEDGLACEARSCHYLKYTVGEIIEFGCTAEPNQCPEIQSIIQQSRGKKANG